MTVQCRRIVVVRQREREVWHWGKVKEVGTKCPPLHVAEVFGRCLLLGHLHRQSQHRAVTGCCAGVQFAPGADFDIDR